MFDNGINQISLLATAVAKDVCRPGAVSGASSVREDTSDIVETTSLPLEGFNALFGDIAPTSISSYTV